jgi:levansucrase
VPSPDVACPDPIMPFRWTAAHIAAIAAGGHSVAPRIEAAQVERIVPGLDLWDHWPVLDRSGAVPTIAGGTLVIALSAPILPDPEARHGVARLRLLHRRRDGWRDLGMLLPDGFSPGSREWAGSAIVNLDRALLTLYFTAAGTRGERAVSFEQRMFATDAVLAVREDRIRLSDWTPPREIVAPDGIDYVTDMAGGGTTGTIKAFRDPYFYRSPTGEESILFAASSAATSNGWNGVIGLAQRDAEGGWVLQPPIVDATALNNELERPHAIGHDGRTYLFWSTQAHVFAPGIVAPTGLYGLVGDTIGGPWRPLNGHGLVFANPAEAPAQAYSWQVLPDLSVWGFANCVGLTRAPASTAEARASFAGTPAPLLRLRLGADRAALT